MDKTTSHILLTFCDIFERAFTPLELNVHMDDIRKEIKGAVATRKKKEDGDTVDGKLLSDVITYYKKQSGGQYMKNWNAVYWQRCAKPASDLIKLADGNAEKVKRAIDSVQKIQASRGWKWTLETVVKMYPQVGADDNRSMFL